MASEEETYRLGIERRLDTQDVKLDQILEQTKKTNGRVTQLEIDKAVQTAQLKVIRTILYAMAGSVTFVMGSVVVPILVAYIQAH